MSISVFHNLLRASIDEAVQLDEQSLVTLLGGMTVAPV